MRPEDLREGDICLLHTHWAAVKLCRLRVTGVDFTREYVEGMFRIYRFGNREYGSESSGSIFFRDIRTIIKIDEITFNS